MKTLIAASGELGLSTIANLKNDLNICGVLTDSGSIKIINWCNSNNIPVVVGNPRSKSYFPQVKALGEVDLLLSINYLYIIGANLINYPKTIALNIHGSRLPKYRGRAPHIWAIINGETEIGITLHKIDEGCDTGDVLLQRIITLNSETTGGEVLDIFSKQYPIMIKEAYKLITLDRVIFTKQDHQSATYFGKRTPDDGEIDWSWDRKRIYDWVRALTEPYPGAFTFYREKKIKIWKVEIGPDHKGIFGNIIEFKDGIIKVQAGDGIVLIKKFSFESDLEISENSNFQSR